MTWLDVFNWFDTAFKFLVAIGGTLFMIAALFFLIYAAGELLFRMLERLD